MHAGSRAVRLIAALVLFVSPVLTTAGDWPTSLHDPQRSATGSDETLLSPTTAAQLTQLWAFPTGGVVAASAAIVGSTVYVGSWDGFEYALDAVTGAQKWKTFTGITTARPVCNPSSAGITSAATVQNGVVYVGGGDAYWYALDAVTGAVLWRVFTGDNSADGGHYNWSSPLVYNGYAYIGIASMGDCPLVQGQLLQVSLSTHQVVNTFDVVPKGMVGGGIWNSPTLDPATNTLFLATGTRTSASQVYAEAIVALDATTLAVQQSWQLPQADAVTDSDWGTSATLFHDAGGTPMIAANNKNGFTYAFNRTRIAAGPVWRQQIAYGGQAPTAGDGSVAASTFDGARLYVAGGNTVIAGSGFPGGVRAVEPGSGTFLWQYGVVKPVIAALASANGLLFVGAGATLEVLNAANGASLYTFTTGGTIYGAPSIADGRVFVGSTDGNEYAFGLAIKPPPPSDPNCPSGWTCTDIGNPTPSGSESVSAGAWAVTAGGSGVAGTSDQFRSLGQTLTGDLQVNARLVAEPATAGNAQAGVMVRQSLDPGSPYYAALITPKRQLLVQYRTRFGFATTVANKVAAGVLPMYVEIQRRGDQFQTAASRDGITYTLVPGSTVSMPMPAAVAAGLAVSSGAAGTAWTATYTNVATGPPGPPPVPVSTACPTDWSCAAIGNPSRVGDQSLANGTWTVRGAGSDILNYADQFRFVWQSVAADATVSAHVVTQTNTSGFAKAGVMLRQNGDAGSVYYAALVTPSNGIEVQFRTAPGLRSTVITASAGTSPAFLQVTRSGNTYSAFTSADGTTWSPVIAATTQLNTAGAVLAGLAVTSHNITSLSTATFDSVTVSGSAPPPPGGCPDTWTCAEIGHPSLAGGQLLSRGTWTVEGAGGDIWATADEFHFVWQSMAADGTLNARVGSQTNTGPWAKAGVMLRQSTDPGSAYYAVFVTPGNGIVVQYRPTPGAAALQAHVAGGASSNLRVARSGTTYTAYTSSDGTTWTPMWGSSVTLPMSGALLAGLAVTSHNVHTLSTATFDSVVLGDSAPPPPGVCQSGWTCGEIGTPILSGGQSLSGGTWTVQGAGGDIWTTADECHFVWQSMAGDGALSARVGSQTNTDMWAKAGVMLRQSTDAGAAYYGVFVTPSNGTVLQYRPTPGAATAQVQVAGAVPSYLRVARSGPTYTAYTSTDGTTWTPIAGSSVTLDLSGPLLAGLAVTSHNVNAVSTATFDSVAFGPAGPGTTAPLRVGH